ncbi:hypothetical protein VOLCADRAFT_108465 [Volvox carteri f. nagariensis]|uniref:Uncharacterized protein n=1 Tax=Volvox carteri f. nagariensis TaxID=3068 RepID=D8UKA5_VOLCA|nr:uncharacterized protein VOLCADRAFT_108465 [Volvox carteri f. nagariensis]EFJ39854.1 hypothetical protein VOLCADRAFT_108465 [Volvox carteri f. nagariensis]|eukprot:XP_002959091.1 hypothetical protein VOLCADRAFT_108465 [Volvox carteri f. nagariensis]
MAPVHTLRNLLFTHFLVSPPTQLLVYSHHYTGRRAQPRSIAAPPPASGLPCCFLTAAMRLLDGLLPDATVRLGLLFQASGCCRIQGSRSRVGNSAWVLHRMRAYPLGLAFRINTMQPSDSMQLRLGASLPERKPAGAGLADKRNTTYRPKAAPPGCFTAREQKPAGNPALVLAFQLNASKPTGPRPLSLGALPRTPWGWPFGAAQCNPDASLPESITRPNTEMGAATAEVETAMAAEGAEAGEQDGQPGAMQLLQPGMALASGSGLQQPNTEMGATTAEVDTAMAAEGAEAGEQDGRLGAMQLLQPGMALASGSGLQQFPKISGPESVQGSSRTEFLQHSNLSLDEERAIRIAKQKEFLAKLGLQAIVDNIRSPRSPIRRQSTHSAPFETRRSTRLTVLSSKLSKQQVKMPTHAAEAAVVEDTAAVVVNHDPEMHLKIFSDQHKTWAEMHNLDLKADEGQLLAAILQWPEQYKLYCGSEGSFHHSFAVCGILVANGMYAPDFNNPKLQAINHFTEDMKSALLSGGLKQFELALLLAGLNALCQGDVGAQGQQVRKRAKSAASNDCSKRTKRTAQEMAGLLEKEFHSDIMSASNFKDIPEVKVRIAELINKFGGTEGATTMVGIKAKANTTEEDVAEELMKSLRHKWKNLRNMAKKTQKEKGDEPTPAQQGAQASVSIEDTIEILVIGKMKGLHHRAKFTLPEPTKTLAIKDSTP